MTNIKHHISRRTLLTTAGGAALAGAIGGAQAAVSNVSGMPQEGPDTPKLTMYISADPSESEMKKIKQIGVNIVDMPDMPPPPWTEDWFRKRMDLLAVMKELIKNNYKHLIMPEHPRTMENDKGQKNGGYTGWVYNVGYARAMMQVALMELRKS